MRLQIIIPGKEAKKIKEKVSSFLKTVESETYGNGLELVCLIEPGSYKEIDRILEQLTRGQGKLEVLNLKEIVDTEDAL